jgi:hypothetical protein
MSAYAKVLRAAAAGAAGEDSALVQHAVSAVIYLVTAAVVFVVGAGTASIQGVGESGIMLAAEIMKGVTQVGSTTPSNNYEIQCRMIEYDA